MSTSGEFDAFVMGDIAMGVAGTAIVADMGARKVRDELAAMSTWASTWCGRWSRPGCSR